jgi:perosamine synthetase
VNAVAKQGDTAEARQAVRGKTLIDYRLPMAAPDIRDEDIDAVAEALRSGMLSQGPFTRRFEAAFAAYIGVTDAIAVSSGTSALHLCIRAAGIGEGDEVITSPFGYIASANCILFERGTPVFVDIDEETMNIDPRLVPGAVTERTRAVLPVHVFGQPCAMRELQSACAEHDLILIEDACEAVGAEYEGRKVGSFGHFAVFSFFPNKQMTTGEGAMITCGDARTGDLLRSLRNQGREEGGAWLKHVRLGYNYRMTELSAALGVTQLARLEEMLSMREKVARLYKNRFEAMSGIRLIEPSPSTTRLSWFAAIARLDPAFDRDVVITRLEALGIPARAYFAPLHLQPVYRQLFGFEVGDFPIAERVARTTLALPFHNAMTERQVGMVCEALEQVLT